MASGIKRSFFKGMWAEGLTGAIVFGLILFRIYKIETRMQNKNPNDVSIGKMSMDSGKSVWEIRRKYGNGDYDKDDKWKI